MCVVRAPPVNLTCFVLVHLGFALPLLRLPYCRMFLSYVLCVRTVKLVLRLLFSTCLAECAPSMCGVCERVRASLFSH